MGFLTYGELSASGSGSTDEFNTICGDIKAHAVVDANSLSGEIKWVERVTRSGAHVQEDEVFVPPSFGLGGGIPFNSVICPAFTPGN